jgi:hypothetical protein
VSAVTVEVLYLWRDRVRSFLWTTASYDVPAMFGADVVSLKLMKGFAMTRTITHMNPPVAVPQITEANT